MVMYVASSQINIRTSDALVDELDVLVDRGIFRNRTEAVNEGIRLIIYKYKAMKTSERIDRIARKKYGKGKVQRNKCRLFLW